ncbi:MAG: hypothetical protein LJE95_00490, partial [Acidobacteria bacterium]|nr:hypothetical protein [Acidobacteriota bacterium]
CIYELDPVTRTSTGTKICPATAAAPIGLAYDPVSDTFLAGSWDDGVINRFDRSGTVLDSVNVNLSIAGLAYNPSTHHLFVLVNDAAPADVYVLDTADNFHLLRSFAIQDLGDYEQGGLEIDCAGNLWAVDQVSGEVLEVASGETGACDYMDAPWLDVSPSSGAIMANATKSLTLSATTIGQLPGLHQAQLAVVDVDPLAPISVPICFTVAFHDVPEGSFGDVQIHAIAGAGVTFGCGSGIFCPADNMTRGVMARWMINAMHGPNYSPPPCAGIFVDVPCETTSNSDYIEALYNEGVTAGCNADPLMYCPDSPVLRSQMAVFLLKARLGSGYKPPACTGIFDDVACPGGFAVDWIEDLYNQGVTAGCTATSFCPDSMTRRDQMAVFVKKNWNMPTCQ